MLRIYNYCYINRTLSALLLLCFTLTSLPLRAEPTIRNGINEILFWIRMEAVIREFVKSEKKSTESIITQFVEIKREIEHAYYIKFDIDNYLNQIARELSKRGIKNPCKEFSHISDMIHKREEKIRKQNTYHVGNYKKKDKEKKDPKEEEEFVVPTLLVYGVTLALCGFFMMCIPIPTCKDWGGKMVVAGVTACANSLSVKKDENDKKDKDKK